jgi:hypothetical protein
MIKFVAVIGAALACGVSGYSQQFEKLSSLFPSATKELIKNNNNNPGKNAMKSLRFAQVNTLHPFLVHFFSVDSTQQFQGYFQTASFASSDCTGPKVRASHNLITIPSTHFVVILQTYITGYQSGACVVNDDMDGSMKLLVNDGNNFRSSFKITKSSVSSRSKLSKRHHHVLFRSGMHGVSSHCVHSVSCSSIHHTVSILIFVRFLQGQLRLYREQ